MPSYIFIYKCYKLRKQMTVICQWLCILFSADLWWFLGIWTEFFKICKIFKNVIIKNPRLFACSSCVLVVSLQPCLQAGDMTIMTWGSAYWYSENNPHPGGHSSSSSGNEEPPTHHHLSQCASLPGG